MKPLESATYEMIEAGGRTAQTFGFNRLFGQIYMLLFMSPEPACLDVIAESLGISKASASIACRQLESWGVLHKVWMKGDRKDYYEAITDISQIVNNGLLASVNKKLVSAQYQIQRSRSLLEESRENSERVAFLKQRLAQAEKYRARLEALLNNPLIRKLI
ncbi:MAG: hypothetical protein PHP44_02895 [Kiritimatiellae bacterium]|nr:hypothetical protein [Kiritimatiellia bacterium]MDD4735035.1 hypothetical protein [Kiritimatiellia bacterium]